MFLIYVLERNQIPFYIGKCVSEVQRRNAHKRRFGKDINYFIIDKVEDWKFWERHYISLFKSWGFELENKNNGGGGPTKWTKEQKASINPKRILKIKNNSLRGRRISKSLINHSKHYTQEIRDKISKGNKGKTRTFSTIHKDNLSKAKTISQGKRVQQYDLNNNLLNTFESKSSAAKWMMKNKNGSINIDKQIKDCCLGRQKTCYNYIWKYE